MANVTIKDPSLEPFYILKDQYCYAVTEAIFPEGGGKEYFKSHTYHTDLGGALKKVCQLKLQIKIEDQILTLRQYLDEWRLIQDEIKILLQKLNI